MSVEDFIAEWRNKEDYVLVHTSGSMGTPKPMYVKKSRMETSARITCKFLGIKPGDTALLCLPVDYIAGKMMVVRALTHDLNLVSVPPTSHPLAECDATIDFAAMVPMQVYNTLQVPYECERLREIKNLIIGGGAIDDMLADRLKNFPHAVWSSYGMTETLSHIALRRINGKDTSRWYKPFSSVSVTVNGEGCLIIDAPEVCEQILTTNDIAQLREDGCFRIMGRRDNVICSGGIKIQIEDVEQLLSCIIKEPFLITKSPDPVLGEALVLLTENTDLPDVMMKCKRVLPKYWQPRRILHVDDLPQTETGKPARKKAEQIVVKILSKT